MASAVESRARSRSRGPVSSETANSGCPLRARASGRHGARHPASDINILPKATRPRLELTKSRLVAAPRAHRPEYRAPRPTADNPALERAQQLGCKSSGQLPNSRRETRYRLPPARRDWGVAATCSPSCLRAPERVVKRLGGKRAGIRSMCTWWRDQIATCSSSRGGCFREEVYYRIAVVDVNVPPLRERASREDNFFPAVGGLHLLTGLGSIPSVSDRGLTSRSLARIRGPAMCASLRNALERADRAGPSRWRIHRPRPQTPRATRSRSRSGRCGSGRHRLVEPSTSRANGPDARRTCHGKTMLRGGFAPRGIERMSMYRIIKSTRLRNVNVGAKD